MQKFYNKLFKNTLSTILTVVVSVLLIVGFVSAATTISTNIDTDGTLVVDGNATTSGYLIVGSSIWAAPTSTLTVDGTAYFTGKATTSQALWLGTAGVADYVNLDGGDLYVQGDAEIDGTAYLTGGIFTDATVTVELVIGDSVWDAPTSTLTVDGTAYFTGKATTSQALWLGTAGVADYVNLDGGDLYVQGDAEIDGGLWVNSATTTDTLVIGGNATTTGKAVFNATGAGTTATTTATFGNNETIDTEGLCLKFYTGGQTVWCYLDSTPEFDCSSSVSCE